MHLMVELKELYTENNPYVRTMKKSNLPLVGRFLFFVPVLRYLPRRSSLSEAASSVSFFYHLQFEIKSEGLQI